MPNSFIILNSSTLTSVKGLNDCKKAWGQSKFILIGPSFPPWKLFPIYFPVQIYVSLGWMGDSRANIFAVAPSGPEVGPWRTQNVYY